MSLTYSAAAASAGRGDALANRRGILSHDPALGLHELCGINPAQIHITIPTTYRLQKPVPKRYRIHPRGSRKAERTFYEGIPIVTPYRAITDELETGIRADLLHQAIDTAWQRGLVRGSQLRRLRKMLAARGRW